MTNERELLELAAKAAGISGKYFTNYVSDDISYEENDEGILYKLPDGRHFVWNPITNDGDSDRLGTAIRADVKWLDEFVSVEIRGVMILWEYFSNHGGDKQKALRMARLRAAAEIGRNMK